MEFATVSFDSRRRRSLERSTTVLAEGADVALTASAAGRPLLPRERDEQTGDVQCDASGEDERLPGRVGHLRQTGRHRAPR